MTPSSKLLASIAILLALISLAFIGGGVWLAALGGSWYYLLAGAVLLLCAARVWRAAPSALGLYAALLAATLAWSLWEVGAAWWGIAARGDLLFVLGLLLWTPWIGRRLTGATAGRTRDIAPESPGRHHRSALAAVLVGYAVLGVASWWVDPTAIDGSLASLAAGTTAPAAASSGAAALPGGEWRAYGGTSAGQRYSPLAQITPANVAGLEVAWTYHSGDLRGPADPLETTDEVTPLKVGGRLYLCTPHQVVVALDADTGAEAWRFDPKLAGGLALQHLTCRGLSYQAPPPIGSEGAMANAEGSDVGARAAATATGVATQAVRGVRAAGGNPPATPARPHDECAAKLYLPTADGRLIALDPDTGTPCRGFGGGSGQIDLWAGMPNRQPGSYYSTSPVVVTQKVLVVGGTVLDNVSTTETSGVIRGYDAGTGRLLWNWDSARPQETAPIAAGARYTPNSPNSWSIMSADEALGLVYVPMGNQPPDQWGGQRSAEVERYSSSVVALEIASGKVRWVFQTVHHDLWDYDVPAQPSLVDLDIGGAKVPALVQPTKQGELFVLDRRTGRPLLPVQERASPQGAAAGDHTAPTQPVSALSFEPKPLTGASMWGATPLDQLACRIAFARLRYDGRFTPPSTQGSLIYPGNLGVFNWGGIAVDPVRQIAFTTPTYLAFVSRLVPRPDGTSLLVQGKTPPQGSLPALNENFGAPFAVQLKPFTSVLGLPCQAPPWGYVAGADLRTGHIAWQHRNGTTRDSSPLPIWFSMGVPNLGGPIVTAGGVAFLSGTRDDYVRGYEVASGHELWKARLPAGGQATPMTYLAADGRQMLVVVAGGHGSFGTKSGDAVIAYRLPRTGPVRAI